MSQALKPVDHNALKVNQIVIISLNVLAFILQQPWLAGVVAVAMLIGTIMGKPGFVLIYRHLALPFNWIKPEIIPDNPEPHRFSQGLGGVFMLAGTVALFFGRDILGWILVWMVAGLAALNAFGGFCVGCFIYYWLGRFGLFGFIKEPPVGVAPGFKPK